MTNAAAEPPPEDVERGLARLEEYVAASARMQDDAEEEPEADDADPFGEVEPYRPAPLVLPDGDTKRVRELAAEVAEAHRLIELQSDETPLLLDTPKVRKRRKAAMEAARLHQLAQDPAALAYRDARVRRLTTVMLMAAACVGLAISSIGVQASVVMALDISPGSVAWWAAFGVEPALSLPLLAAVAVQAYSAMRGHVVDRKSSAGRKLFRTEAILLGLTLTLNCWPALFGVFDPLALIVHSLGPVAAVVAVWVLPAVWKVLEDLPLPEIAMPAPGAVPGGVYRGATGPTYSGNAVDRVGAAGASVAALVERARVLIDKGELPPNPSATKIRKALRCGADAARAVRDEIAGGAP